MIGINNENYLRKSIVLLRLFIGWHFFYEGIIKLYNPEWTSFGYLASSQGFLHTFFLGLTNESLIGVTDWSNIIALLFVGAAFILGISEKLGALIGVGLLALYYLAHPSFPWVTQLNVEGSYWFINKNLIELAACLVIFYFPTGDYFGLKYLLNRGEKTKTEVV